MIPTQPTERFLLVQMVRGAKTAMAGGIEVVLSSQPCGMGRVLVNNSVKHASIPVGDIVFFPVEQANFVQLDPVAAHAFLFEDAVMGSAKAADIQVSDVDITAKASAPAGIMVPKGNGLPRLNRLQ